jgi:hypothetical protein
MSLVREHLYFYDRAFGLDGFIQDPVMVFGRHRMTPSAPETQRRNLLEFWSKRYRPIGGVWLHKPPKRLIGMRDIHEVLRCYGATDVRVLDYFDEKADLIHDMNCPLPSGYRHSMGTFIDIGSIEHVFDTRQCLTNMIEIVRPGGHLFIVTPCSGFYNHGFHVFSPECLLQALEINGFEIRWVTHSTPGGLELDSPQHFKDVLIWIVARKVREMSEFICPQQGRWKVIYQADRA